MYVYVSVIRCPSRLINTALLCVTFQMEFSLRRGDMRELQAGFLLLVTALKESSGVARIHISHL